MPGFFGRALLFYVKRDSHDGGAARRVATGERRVPNGRRVLIARCRVVVLARPALLVALARRLR